MNSDRLQSKLERYIPRLRGGVIEGLINQEEMKMILKKRNDFEYSISRNKVELEDYKHYIQYESQLERLRKKRRARLATPENDSDMIFKENIVRLYQVAANKFRNVEHIRQQIQFCKENGLKKEMNDAYQKAIEYFPRKEEFWIGAAEEEEAFEVKRVIYQRAIRLNSKSSLLWISYCRTELNFLVSLVENGTKKKEDPSLQKIPLIIARESKDNLREDANLRVQLLELFEEYSDKLNVEDSINEIKKSIQEDFPNDLKTLHTLVEKPEEKVDLLEKALKTSQDKPGAFREFISYYLSKMSTEEEANQSIDKVIKLFEEAEKKGEWDSQLAIQFADFLIGLGDTEKALQSLEKASEKYSTSIALWRHRTSLHARLISLLSNKGVPLNPKSKQTSVEVWLRVLEYSIMINLPFSTIFDNFKRVIPLFKKNSKELERLTHFAELVRSKFGDDAFKSICECTLTTNIPFSLLMKWIIFERQRSSPSKQTIRKLFEKACSEWGKTSEDLWMEYWTFENEANEMQSGNVYWKAKKTLSNPTKFIQATVSFNNQIS